MTLSSLSRREALRGMGSLVGATGAGGALAGVADAAPSDGDRSADDGTLAACSFNVLHEREGRSYPWSSRLPQVAEALERLDSDLLGIQEARPDQFADIRETLTGYEWYGRGREGGEDSQATPVAWRSDRFELRETGTFWLSPTPEESSVGWDARVPRVANWASLTDGETGTDVWFCNAHVSYVDAKTRRNSAELLRSRAAARAADGETPVLAVDLNAAADTPSYRTLTGRSVDGDDGESDDGETEGDGPVADARRVAPEESVEGPAETYHGFAEEATKRYDYVFTSRSADVVGYRTLGVPEDGYRSDHLPVAARFRP